jgi:hypothetical protein
MNFSARTLLSTIVAGFFASAVYASPPTVNPEPMDLDASTNATIMKEKSKRRNMEQPGGGSGDGSSSSSSGCGQVNINNNDKKSNSGIKDMFGKQQTTIVTGPVINMANCK